MVQLPRRYAPIGIAALCAVATPGDAAAEDAHLHRIEASLDGAEKTMIADPAKVLPVARESRRQLGALPSNRQVVIAGARALWLEGEALGRLNELGGADAKTREALLRIERVAPGSQLHGRILTSRGAVELDQGKVQVAFRDYRRAYDIFRTLGDARSQALALQNIGSIYSDAGDQQSVLRYYAQSADLFAADIGLAVSAHNNIGLAYKELGELRRAEDEYRRAFALAVRMRSPLLEARILNNIGSVQLARGRTAAADMSADRGLTLATDGEAAEWKPFLWGLKAQVAFARGDAPGAVALFGHVFPPDMDLATTSFYYRDFHKTAVDAFLATGDQAHALRHLQAFKRLDDEAREIRSSTNAALNAAQFDFSNQELKISKLKAGQLQRDLAIGQSRARLNQLMLSAALLLLAVTLAGLFSLRRSRNQTRAANASLETTNLSLDKALKAKSEFLATTSHEIRTPLNGILGMAQVLLGRGRLVDEDRERVGLINSAGAAMKAIVDDILDMARIESGRVEVHRAPFDLPAVLTEVGALWRAEAERKGLEVTLELADAPSRIVSDERKIRQVIFNLVSNAVKFTDIGRVAIGVSVTGRDGSEELRIVITDTGIGIPADQIDAVFEAFHQVEGGTTRKVGGTGLGLAISANLAQAIGGQVMVASTPGEGSRFELILPLERAHSIIEAKPLGQAPRRLDEACVLMLEPNPLFQSIFSATLQPEVARVEMAESLDAAEQLISVAAPDLMIVDGASVLGSDEGRAALHRWAGRSDLRLLLLSGGDEAEADALVANGTVAVQLRKTLPPVGLAAALAAMLAPVAGSSQSRAA